MVGNIYQYLSNRKISNKLNESDSIISNMPPGSKVLVKYQLAYGKKGESSYHSFSVVYECNIIDTSEDMIKIETIDFTSIDARANDPQSRLGILKFLNERWINKSEAQLVVDDSKRRENKINQILDN